MVISTNILKILADITGEPRFDFAIRQILKDAIEHRVERIEREIKQLEKKYEMKFEEFEKKFQKEEISNQYSYEIEKDYLEWEGLVGRLKKYQKLLESLA
ncbi:MAG TPA: hypothetical protein ENI35_00550 [Candidatus Desulfofervidus auxilii]|uniref:Uncharacterized protein n=1 Tax=Desulfofervidus auxilii TaxID=1621989 RepID=A0A7C1W047_DESA2|nr:hypothetical protein [Candidatus Desulfofervidus auxilii]